MKKEYILTWLADKDIDSEFYVFALDELVELLQEFRDLDE